MIVYCILLLLFCFIFSWSETLFFNVQWQLKVVCTLPKFSVTNNKILNALIPFVATWSRFHQRFMSSFYSLRSKSAKRHCWLDCLFSILWSAPLKAARKHVGEINSCCHNFENLFKMIFGSIFLVKMWFLSIW